MDNHLYSTITSFYNTTSKNERQTAEKELHRIQAETSTWNLLSSWFQDARPHCDMFAAQTLHIKINRDLDQLGDDDSAGLRQSIQSWIHLVASQSVKSKLNQALATLLVKTEKHPVEHALGNVELLSMIPEECERTTSTQYALKHELKASASKVIESMRSIIPVNELWLECIKSWSIYLDQIPSWLIQIVQHQMKDNLSLVIDILCIWFTRKDTQPLLHLLPSITSVDCSEEVIGEMARLYGTYGECHSDYLCLDPQEHFFTNALHLTTAITCRSEMEEPLLVSDVWEFWYTFHQTIMEHERKETFQSVYAHLLQCALQIAKLPDRITKKNAIFIREVRREVRDLLSCCLYILGNKQFLTLLKCNILDHNDLECRLWTINVCSDELEGEELGEFIQLPPIGSHHEIHKQLLVLMRRFPQLAPIDYVLQHLPGHFEREAARVLDSIVQINEPFLISIYDSIKNIVSQTGNSELKASLCSTYAKIESLPAGQLGSLLESTGTDFNNCINQAIKFCDYSPELCTMIISHFDASPGAYEVLAGMVRSFKVACLPFVHKILPIVINSPRPLDSTSLVDFLCAIPLHMDDEQLAQNVIAHLASIDWDADCWMCIYDSLTKLAQCNPAWIPASLVAIGVELSTSLNPALHRSLVRFYCQLSASSHKHIMLPFVSTLIDINLKLLLKHLAPSQLDSSIRLLYELMRLDLTNAQTNFTTSLTNLSVDATKWTARFLVARNYGRFREASEELCRSYRHSQP